MNILIVHAHENDGSFSSALAKTAKNYFKENGQEVVISDLYQKGFNPVAGKHDFKTTSETDHYKYAIEQLNAHSNKSFADDVQEEMNLLENADILILNFPLWWFGMPAILKGWVDRILAYGFAYGGKYGLYTDGKFKGKKAFLSITTGSPSSFYTEDGTHGRTLENILRNTNEGVLGLIGFDVLPPFIGYSVSRITEKERTDILEDYHSYLNQHFATSF